MPAFRIALLSGAAMAAPAALAQQAGSPPAANTAGKTLSDIVVTAQRRDQNMQDVPITISAFSNAELDRSGIDNIADLGTVVPGLVFSNIVGYSQPYIRGVGTNATGPGFENPVATYVDGVYYAAQAGGLMSLDNIASVEVDKGPQGTLFGRNATGGAIQIRTLDPKYKFGGKASLGYGNYDTLTAQYYVTGGLASNVAANLAAGYSHQGDGYGTNLANGKDVDRTENLALRGKLLWEPGADTRVLVAVDYEKTNGIPTLAPAPGTIPQFAPAVASNPRDVYGDPQPYLHAYQWGVAATVDHDFGAMSLKSISAFRKTGYDSLFDSTLTADPGTTFFITGKEPHRQFSQELQLASNESAPLTWVTGAYFFWERAGYLNPTTIGGESFALYGLPSGILQSPDRRTLSGALFGQGTYETGSGLSLTAGLRYSIEQRKIHFVETLPDFGIDDVDVQDKKTFRNLSWRLAVSQQLTPDMMAYASYNRGYKSGTFNNADPSLYPLVIKPERLDAFELGSKNVFFDNLLRINLSGFLYKYTNMQTTTYPNGSLVIINGGKATLYGLDADMEWAVTSSFHLTAGMEALHSRYDDFPDAPISIPVGLPDGGTAYTTQPGGAKGNRLAKAPNFSAYAALTYAHEFETLKTEANVTYSYNDGWYAEADNRLRQGSYSLVNASVKLSTIDGGLSLEFWGKNLLNKTYAATLASQTNGDYIQYAPPRTYGVTLGTEF
ncbi:TonB-dependent receptor [Novosphingobium album (ex Hu et al. 2023)]|uniref:TonB-dependent receptor n=1 Tax=Novosphingobium album (ex Hu et al. 2023) TaxID=2930093 RepID=A0ABT0B521_9SPHN|nr:TonB-dependent receptor [Novosphingobium album (ex Hu et al. 2023)]MCJ2179986.1 TonB-dependent receptor [Novosphingobium album (ex Hu et al. 2023)]